MLLKWDEDPRHQPWQCRAPSYCFSYLTLTFYKKMIILFHYLLFCDLIFISLKLYIIMKKFIFLWLVLTSFCLCGCSWFDHPANVEIIGVGTVRSDAGLLVVQIDSVKYAPVKVYTNSSTRDGKTSMRPVEGMSVTAFKMHNEPQINFIAGDCNKAYLEEYFSENHTIGFIVLCLVVLYIVFLFWLGYPLRSASKKLFQRN